ncbi:MAG TPA: 30S ribosome-binding factor RbfA [Stellaceae bacterium]|nr:30S ribosome-binding factor RbfA [Stellaceae bacterium]
MARREGSSGRSQRQLRVGEELRHVLAEVLRRGDVRDPELVDATITVTEVRVSPDLRNATAFVVPLGGVRQAEILAALRRVAPYLRGVIGRAVALQFTPTLGFELDRSFDRAAQIERLLHRPDVAADLVPGDDDGPQATDVEGTGPKGGA